MIQRTALTHPLQTVSQPIFEISNGERTLHAVEYLTRGPHGSTFEDAPQLFKYIRRLHLEAEMDRVCIAQALLRAAGDGGAHRISVNVHPITLATERDFASFLVRQSEAAGIDVSRLIVEIGEQTPAEDIAAFQRSVCGLRDRGVHIAIDDVGSNHANYRSILDCRPEYLKIDRYFITGVGDDPARQAVVRSICDLGSFFSAQIVAEGVERIEDHDALSAMGIRLFQGFLYARPSSPEGHDRGSTIARVWLNGFRHRSLAMMAQPTR